MPELPEVEIIARHLHAELPGRRIEVVRTSRKRLRAPLGRAALARAVGRTFTGARRLGKYVLCDLDDGHVLLFHLGMSGHLVLEGADARAPRHTHVLVALDRGRLRFTDPRRFGVVRLCHDEPAEVARLGPDPLDPQLTVERLAALLARTRRAIKDALLDQRLVAGLGNIYACEALFAAGLSPWRRAHRLRPAEVARLLDATRAVLRGAIERRGTTLPDRLFVGGDGRAGANFAALRVFARAGEPCPRCGRAITRARQGARSTFWCLACQG